jgi:putative membrane protein
MGLVCYELARRVTESAVLAILLGATFMVLWDVSLDPAMSRAFPFWTYEENGFFYGMPLSNWGGWFVTSAVIMGAYSGVTRGITIRHRLAPWFFFLNCAFPFMLSLLYGLYGAAAAGAVSSGFVLLLVRSRSRTHDAAATPGG